MMFKVLLVFAAVCATSIEATHVRGKRAASFFVKRLQTGMCINDTRVLQTSESWGNFSFVELSNNCLDPAAQSRFVDNSAMFNLKRKGCFEGTKRSGTGYKLPMLYMLLHTDPSYNCRDKEHAITQTSWGGLFVYYIPDGRTRCAVPKTDVQLATNPGIDPYIELTTNCNDTEDKRFNFGSVTCHGSIVKNANCPKDQYMVVKTASTRGLSATKTCSLSDDYSCKVDVTCLVKKQCDGQHECNITVNDNLFSGDLCPGLSKYLYFEYQCIDKQANYVCALFPDKPTNLTVTNIKSRSAEISWLDPYNAGDKVLSRFLIKMKKENSLFLNTTTNKVNKYKSDNLTPFTKYEISVAAGNQNGFGEETITSFVTSEEAPEGPPLNVTVTTESSSSLSVTWEPPEKVKRNGIIASYTVCISHEESKPCFREHTTKKKMIVIDNLIDSTKYYVRVLASTNVGPGPYSESKGKFTNGKPPEVSTNGTKYTLSTFSLQIPSRNFTYFYVVALKSKDGKQGQSPESYGNNDLVTYAEARTSTDPKPYIAAIVTSKDENIFILGDGRNTSYRTSRRRRSTLSDYYNGPLEPGTSYIIFQRIFINDKGDYYSTDWSSASKTSEYADIDECKNPSLYSCHSGFDCVNTLSSYECVCNGRITNGKCEDEGYTRYRLNLRLKEEYTNALSNNASQEFKAIETRITNAMAKVYENNDAYYGIEVKKMKNGSVVAEMELIFTDKNKKGISELLEAVRNNSFGDFDVDPNALTVVMTGTCESQQCPGNSTCKQLTADTISCPCNDGYYYDGVSCKEFIVIKVEVALEKEFTEELKNKSSQVYQELERNITAELYETFKDTPNFQEVVVLGFRNGSVIVDFKVVYRKDKNNKKIVVAETVREQIVKTGKLGNYQVKSAIVQGSPPPPAGLKETGKTDNSIDISWEKPKGHSAFVINGYMVRHKTDAETQYKNQYISSTSGVLNAVLTGLESDTIYEITVHAYNNDGNGTKLKIQVTTEKPDDSTTVVIIVVVIVIVLLLIIAMVVFFQLRKRRYRYETRRAAYANRSNEGPMTMGLATMPYKSTNYDNYGQTDEEASTSQKL